MKLLKVFTLSSMVAAGTVMRENEASASDIAESKQRQRRFGGIHFLYHHFLGDDVADETASSADNSMKQSENMPKERERRFWVRLFLKVMSEKIDFYRVHWLTRLVALPETSLVKKVKTGTVHMQQCPKNDKDDFG